MEEIARIIGYLIISLVYITVPILTGVAFCVDGVHPLVKVLLIVADLAQVLANVARMKEAEK